MLEVPSVSLLTWVILSLYFFYATGHQPTFPNIAWGAAFVGTGGEFSHNFVPATLVIINTFGSHLLMGLTLPLLLLAPFTLFVMVPSLGPKKNNPLKDFGRGDILIYERDSIMINNAFTLCCKYILCHAIRVSLHNISFFRYKSKFHLSVSKDISKLEVRRVDNIQ